MGDLVAANWQPNSQYWVYKRYADQTGLRTSVTAGTQVDAVAYQDAEDLVRDLAGHGILILSGQPAVGRETAP